MWLGGRCCGPAQRRGWWRFPRFTSLHEDAAHFQGGCEDGAFETSTETRRKTSRRNASDGSARTPIQNSKLFLAKGSIPTHECRATVCRSFLRLGSWYVSCFPAARRRQIGRFSATQ